jgi:ABC-type lipoprotein release transport system permease subunit
MYGLIIGTVGAIIGAVAGTDKTIQLEGMTDSEIQETLDKLRKKARIRDYK